MKAAIKQPIDDKDQDVLISASSTSTSYFPRHLRVTNAENQTRQVDEEELLTILGPKVVLGEPGMGKSRLIEQLGRKLGIQLVTAVRFLNHKDPSRLVIVGKPLLIDGLDEALARGDGDAIDTILAQLEAAGSPDFILSCRAREWQSRTATNLHEIYGHEPVIFSLEALTRNEASLFLEQNYPYANSAHVLDHLDEHSISELYCNPLTLELIGKVAEQHQELPATRAELFDRSSRLLWPEHDAERQDIGLGRVTENQALSSAGAIMAGMLFAGSDAISIANPGQIQVGDSRLADLARLPGADAAREIFSSKLFYSVSGNRAKPIHRVIAEFLAARWLVQQAKTPRTQRRLLRQIQGQGAVPASLRGLHAWLAFHGPSLAIQVISADPFGVLRYGETSSLTSEQANCMFDALESLGKKDPYFRAQDWGSPSTVGLMKPILRDKIDTTISSPKSNTHFRSLLIEGLKGTSLAGDLSNTLERIVFSSEHYFQERQNAAITLMPHRDRNWWRKSICVLRDQATADSARLAVNLIEEIECDVTDEVLVAALLSDMGVTCSPIPQRNTRETRPLKDYRRIVELLPTERLTSILNLLSDHAFLIEESEWRTAHDFDEILSSILIRTIDYKVVCTHDAALVWNWLRKIKRTDTSYGSQRQALLARLNENSNLRNAVQYHALYVTRPQPTIWMSEIELGSSMVGLAGRPQDVIWFLENLADLDNKDPALRGDWCDLMRFGVCHADVYSDIRAASRKFQADDRELKAFVRKLENPKIPAWKHRENRRKAKKERTTRIKNEQDRRFFSGKKSLLLAGELNLILNPAKAYLGIIITSQGKSPSDQLLDWLGAELYSDVLVGFEAALHRKDIPTPTDIARSFAEKRMWNYCFAIIAGLLERHRRKRDFKDVPVEVLISGLLLLCENHLGLQVNEEHSALRCALEEIVIPASAEREVFARTWIEPSLHAGSSSILGLYALAHEKPWHAIAEKLASEWLIKFADLDERIELQLVECLTHSGSLSSLKLVAEERDSVVFRNEDHALNWLAIDILVRFEAVQPHLADIATQYPYFIWFLRNRFNLERRYVTLPVQVAQAKWIVSSFRKHWPYAVLSGTGSGDTNPYDATDFLRAMINRIADDTSADACKAMDELKEEPNDSYSDFIRHMAVQQHQKRAEEEFSPLSSLELEALLCEGPPSTASDLKSLVIEELAVAQRKLMGDDLDQIRDFWGDDGIPYNENRCRDRLTALIEPELLRYGIHRITEADMPNSKRADLAFAIGTLQLPMEIKGQWHSTVWEAATSQLDAKYLIDWRSDQRGIYCVLWFGDLPSRSGRRLFWPRSGHEPPRSAAEMRCMLVDGIPESRRALIDVVVLDLTAGMPRETVHPSSI